MRLHDVSNVWTNRLGPCDEISDRHVRRVALLNNFLQFYLPKRRDDSTSHFAFLTHLSRTNQSPLLELTIDALCLTMLGSVHQDRRCLHASRNQYIRALPILAHEIGRSHSTQTPKDHVLAAILILALTDLFDAVAHGRQDDEIWGYHVCGAAKLLRSIGPKAVAHFTPLGWSVFQNLRHSLFCYFFMKRKATFLAGQTWLEATADISRHDTYSALYDLVVQIPGMLQWSKEVTGSSAARLFEHIFQLRTELDEWLHKRFSGGIGEYHELVEVQEMQEFATACQDRTFPMVYSFPSAEKCSQYQCVSPSIIFRLRDSLMIANAIRLYLIACFTLDTMYRRLRYTQGQLQQTNAIIRAQDRIERDIYAAAAGVCKTIPFCCKLDTLSAGRIGIVLLCVLQNYFVRHGHYPESGWCHAAQQVLRRTRYTEQGSFSEIEADTIARDQAFWRFWTSHEPMVLLTHRPLGGDKSLVSGV